MYHYWYLCQLLLQLLLLLVEAGEDLAGEAAEAPAALAVELQQVGVEPGEGGAVGDGQQGHPGIHSSLQSHDVTQTHCQCQY